MSDLGDILGGLSGDIVGDFSPQGNGGVQIPYAKSLTKEAFNFLTTIAGREDPRSPGFHASGMYSVCDREFLLTVLTEKSTQSYIEAELRLKFLLGHQIHSLLQDDILGPAGLIKGFWKCRKCGWYYNEPSSDILLPFPNRTCQCCGNQWWGYVEPKVRIAVPGVPDEPMWNIVGACDGIRTSGGVLDIKTISPRGVGYLEDSWGEVDAETDWGFPNEKLSWSKKSVRKYFVQLQLYMHGFNEKSGIVLYVPKDTIDDMKTWIEIPVEYNKDVVDIIFDKIRRIYSCYQKITDKSIDSVPDLPKRVCHTATCYRARDCAVADECFRMKNG